MKVSNYRWAKEHGLCVRCMKETPAPGKMCCEVCAAKNAERQVKYNHSVTKEQKAKYAARRRAERKERKEKGLCAECGRKAYGKYICLECTLKRRRQRLERKHEHESGCERISKKERPIYGMCYTCGKPVIPGKRLCGEHYEIICENMKKARESKGSWQHPC